MGMFDTFIFQTPIPCDECGQDIRSTQSKSFGQLLETYKPGDIVLSSYIRHGIIEETCYCNACWNREERKDTHVFLVIWHSVYAGTYIDEGAAMDRLQSVDRLDLLDWIDNHQKERDLWQRRFRSLFSDMATWHKYNTAEDKEKFLARPFPFINPAFQDHLKNENPFASILREHEVHREEGSDPFD